MKKIFRFTFYVILIVKLEFGIQEIAFAQQSNCFLPPKIITLTCKPIDVVTKNKLNWVGENIYKFLKDELGSLGFLVLPSEDIGRADFQLAIKYTGIQGHLVIFGAIPM